MGQRQPQRRGHLGQRLARQPALLRLQFPQDLHQRMRRVAMACQQGLHVRRTCGQGLMLGGHRVVGPLGEMTVVSRVASLSRS